MASAISKRDYGEAELAALDQLGRWRDAGYLILSTSRQSPREMERVPAQYQAGLRGGLNEVEILKNDHRFLGSYTIHDPYGGSISNPLVTDIVDEGLYHRLRAEAKLEDDDSKHLMYAVQNGCERFLTLDHHFLDRKAQLETLCPSIRIQKPSDLVAELRPKIGKETGVDR